MGLAANHEGPSSDGQDFTVPKPTLEKVGLTIVAPQVDFMTLTPDSLRTELPGFQSQREAFKSLMQRDFDPASVEQARVLFPEAELQYSFSLIELHVLPAMSEAIVNNGAVDDRSLEALAAAMSFHGVSVEDALLGLTEESERRKREGEGLMTDRRVGTYSLGRVAAYEVIREVVIERQVDKRIAEGLESAVRLGGGIDKLPVPMRDWLVIHRERVEDAARFSLQRSPVGQPRPTGSIIPPLPVH